MSSSADLAQRTPADLEWEEVRDAFDLTPEYTHLGAAQFVASHPRPVRDAIERHRRALDANPVLYVEQHEYSLMERVRDVAARTLGIDDPHEIAVTDSTTLGLGLLYSALPLHAGDEIVTTDHEHYSHREAIRGLKQRDGVEVTTVRLYDGLAAEVRADALIDHILGAVTPRTRVIGVTWVHSDTGLKFPVARLAAALEEVNASREPDRAVRLCVDGVHGFGVETDSMADLGCDFMAAGTHKWIYGPRGTGVLWGRLDRWREMRRVIPSFTETMDAYADDEPLPPMDGRQFTPGGFHSLEYRWAMADAFEFRQAIGEERIRARVHALNRRCREGLAAMPHVTLHTPLPEELSAGITAFDVNGMKSDEAKRRLLDAGIIATVAPYPSALLRLT